MKRYQIRYILLAVTALGLLVWGGALTIPNSFSNGTVISASEMNANFTAVANAVSKLQEGPTVLLVEAAPGSVSVSTGNVVCQTASYTAAANKRAIVHVQASVSAAAAHTFSVFVDYSTDGGSTWAGNGWYSPSSLPAGGWATSVTSHAFDLTAGQTYMFGAELSDVTGGGFTSTDSRCHVVVEIVSRAAGSTLSVSPMSMGDR